MKICKAVATRIDEIIAERKITKYRLAKNAGISDDTLKTLFRDRNDGANLKTVLLIVQGLNMSPAQFFDSPLFAYENLEFK